jgi:mono/diheme cytochrome c family protein
MRPDPMSTRLLASLLASGALLVGCAAHSGHSGGGNSSAANPGPANPGTADPGAANAGAASSSAASSGPQVAQASGAKKLNKFTGDAAAIQQGRALYLQNGCSGCHGVGGGGGMAPAIVDDIWKFGSDDETLFKLIKGKIPEQTMPRVYESLPDEEVWKILAYIRSQYSGDPAKINW